MRRSRNEEEKAVATKTQHILAGASGYKFRLNTAGVEGRDFKFGGTAMKELIRIQHKSKKIQ